MKKIIILLIAFLVSGFSYAQVNGCVFSTDIDTTGEVVYKSCENSPTAWYFTTTLVDSADTIKIYGGTNQPDTSASSEKYTLLDLRDITTDSSVTLITGDEAQHTYLLLYQGRRKNIKIEATAISDTTAYVLEGY